MAEIESDIIGEEASVALGENHSRVDALVRLLEDDRLGFRLEQYVSEQREALVALLTGEAFSVTGGQNLAWKDLFPRVEAYDAVTLPFAEFFAMAPPILQRRMHHFGPTFWNGLPRATYRDRPATTTRWGSWGSTRFGCSSTVLAC